jgi:hypothetical protein
MRKKMGMVGWFDPGQLVQTAIRVVISSLFGEFADRREAFAAANPISDDALDPQFDYAKRSPEGELWLDYVADTGDGWNPTYAVARMLAADALRPRTREGGEQVETPLPRARLLVFGGDQVYPTATREDYDNRLIYPFDEAYEREGNWSKQDRPDLFAVPGNHDWYDGLKTFFHLFCRRTIKSPGEAEVGRDGKVIGGRCTHQTRSYFALKLPQGWWLWGTDSQLAGYIDQPQVDFFEFVAKHWMEPGSKLILCTGTPDWEYVHSDKPGTFDGLSYLERLAPSAPGMNHELKLVLSGDSHHYARFQEQGLNYVTCGGGGAFLHPTHQLPKEPVDFQTRYPRPGVPYDPDHGPYHRRLAIARKEGTQDEALYPDRRSSARMTAWNILFAFRNWKLTATLAAGYLFFIWLLDFNARVSERAGSLPEALTPRGLRDAVGTYWELALYSPWSAILLGLTGAAYYYFADIEKTWKRILIGGSHALLHAALVTLTTCLVVREMVPETPEPSLLLAVGSLAAAAVVSATVSATVIGLYLWFCLSVFGIHWGHYSSLAIQGYKSFLRMHIGRDGALTVHPIGLTKVPADRGWPWSRSKPPRNPELDPHLIEPPIRIS